MNNPIPSIVAIVLVMVAVAVFLIWRNKKISDKGMDQLVQQTIHNWLYEFEIYKRMTRYGIHQTETKIISVLTKAIPKEHQELAKVELGNKLQVRDQICAFVRMALNQHTYDLHNRVYNSQREANENITAKGSKATKMNTRNEVIVAIIDREIAMLKIKTLSCPDLTFEDYVAWRELLGIKHVESLAPGHFATNPNKLSMLGNRAR